MFIGENGELPFFKLQVREGLNSILLVTYKNVCMCSHGLYLCLFISAELKILYLGYIQSDRLGTA